MCSKTQQKVCTFYFLEPQDHIEGREYDTEESPSEGIENREIITLSRQCKKGYLASFWALLPKIGESWENFRQGDRVKMR